ncbi:MAG TPA: GntR family transcriptional regulator [Acidobacteriaceae bacterium]|nr:GntR family transcriptional regulator [Acidobacteriaceae bacterium]
MSRNVTLQVDLSSATPAYRQIVDGLRTLLVSGELRPGDSLPTVRSLGLDLGVHFSTVAEAYRTLSEEGWLELKRHHGAFVTDRRSPAPSPAARIEFSTRLRQLIAQVRAAGLPTKDIHEELTASARELSPSAK